MAAALLFYPKSSSPEQRYVPPNLSSSTFSSFFALLKIPSLPLARKGSSKDIACMVYLRDYLPRQPHLVHKRLQRGELQREMGTVSIEHELTEPANFSVKSPRAEHTRISFFNV